MQNHKMEGTKCNAAPQLKGGPHSCLWLITEIRLAASGLLPTLDSVCVASFLWGKHYWKNSDVSQTVISVKKTRPYRATPFNVCFVYVKLSRLPLARRGVHPGGVASPCLYSRGEPSSDRQIPVFCHGSKTGKQYVPVPCSPLVHVFFSSVTALLQLTSGIFSSRKLSKGGNLFSEGAVFSSLFFCYN